MELDPTPPGTAGSLPGLSELPMGLNDRIKDSIQARIFAGIGETINPRSDRGAGPVMSAGDLGVVGPCIIYSGGGTLGTGLNSVPSAEYTLPPLPPELPSISAPLREYVKQPVLTNGGRQLYKWQLAGTDYAVDYASDAIYQGRFAVNQPYYSDSFYSRSMAQASVYEQLGEYGKAKDLYSKVGTFALAEGVMYASMVEGAVEWGVSKVAAQTTTRWGPATGAGPLGKEVADKFRGGSYTEMVTEEATTLYRVYGDKAGELAPWWSRTPPAGPLQARIDSALLPKWGNSAESVSTITVPKGTTIFDGFAARQEGLMGGGSQVYIPEVNPSWLVK